MKAMNNYFSFCLAAAVICCWLAAPACRQQPQSRQYEENGSASAQEPEPAAVQAREGAWSWEKPLRWREEASSGLRLATFSIADRESSGQCTLVPLPGDGGGIQANVQRWLEQLSLPLFSPSELTDFLSRQKKMRTNGGLPVMVIDFTTLGRRQEPSGASMLAAIISGENQTLFVKLRGARVLLEKNSEAFAEFCRSLSPGG